MHASKQIKGEKKLKTILKFISVDASVNDQALTASKNESPTALKISNPVGISARERSLVAEKLKKDAYRNAYVESMVYHGIAHQIRVNRERRSWSQDQFADNIDQSQKKRLAMSFLEDPTYEKYTVRMLLDIARAFDVALTVKFVPFSKFLVENVNKTPEALFAESYQEEDLYLSMAQVTIKEEYLGISTSPLENNLYSTVNSQPCTGGSFILNKKDF